MTPTPASGTPSASRTPGFWFAAAASLIVAAALVGGLLIVGSPGDARLEKLDEARRADLRTIEAELQDGWGLGTPTPDTLGADLFGLAPEFDTVLSRRDGLASDFRHDPATGERYPYRALSDTTAEVCATFAQPHREPPRESVFGTSAIGAHAAGLVCFTLAPDPR